VGDLVSIFTLGLRAVGAGQPPGPDPARLGGPPGARGDGGSQFWADVTFPVLASL
jgi:hypothetical protein